MPKQNFKSTIKKVRDFDFSQEVTITRLLATKEIVNFHYNRMKKAFPDLKDQEIWQRINNIIVRDNVFNEAMKKIVNSYEFKIDSEDVKQVMEAMRKGNPNLAKANSDYLRLMAQRSIEKELIFNDVQKLWKIEVSDQDVKDVLQKMYETSNYPIRDLINNQEKINNLKAPILEQKTADAIISKLKWKLDREAIMKNATASQKPETKKEENKE